MTKLEFLVSLVGDSRENALIERACLLAKSSDGHVVSILSQYNPSEMLAWPTDPTFASTSAPLYDAAAKGNEEAWASQQAFISEIAKTNPNLTLERIIGDRAAMLVKRGSLSDVAVFSCESARGKTMVSDLFTAMLMDARAPILILRGETAPRFTKVAIAWDGGLEASRAAKASLPFLRQADTVIIVQSAGALDEKPSTLTDPQRLQEWLENRGVAAKVNMIAESGDVASQVLALCESEQVDLLVCGAYGHSRAREFVFGGVTRTLLKATDSPSLLLSH